MIRINDLDLIRFALEHRKIDLEKKKLENRFKKIDRKLQLVVAHKRLLKTIVKYKLKPGGFYTNSKSGILVDHLIPGNRCLYGYFFTMQSNGKWRYLQKSKLSSPHFFQIKKMEITDYEFIKIPARTFVKVDNFVFK